MAVVAKGTERQHLIGPVLAIAEHDHAVKIVAARHQRIFKSHEGGKFAGIIITFNDACVFVPDFTAIFLIIFWIIKYGGQGSASGPVDQFCGNFLRSLWPFMHHVMPTAQLGIANQKTWRFIKPPGRAKRITMISNHQKIERTIELRLNPSCRRYFFTLRKPERVFRAKPNAKSKSINRVGCMQMGIAPIDAFGISGFGNLLIAFVGVSRYNLATASEHQSDRAYDHKSSQHRSPPKAILTISALACVQLQALITRE